MKLIINIKILSFTRITLKYVSFTFSLFAFVGSSPPFLLSLIWTIFTTYAFAFFPTQVFVFMTRTIFFHASSLTLASFPLKTTIILFYHFISSSSSSRRFLTAITTISTFTQFTTYSLCLETVTIPLQTTRLGTSTNLIFPLRHTLAYLTLSLDF